MILKLGLQHLGLKLYKVDINDDPGMTLTSFMARSNLVAYVFELEKLLQSREKLAAKKQIDRFTFFFEKKKLTCVCLPLLRGL